MGRLTAPFSKFRGGGAMYTPLPPVPTPLTSIPFRSYSAQITVLTSEWDWTVLLQAFEIGDLLFTSSRTLFLSFCIRINQVHCNRKYTINFTQDINAVLKSYLMVKTYSAIGAMHAHLKSNANCQVFSPNDEIKRKRLLYPHFKAHCWRCEHAEIRHPVWLLLVT